MSVPAVAPEVNQSGKNQSWQPGDRGRNAVRQYVSFWIDGQLFGVAVDLVQEVLQPQIIARAPRACPEVAGLLNLRGQIVTAIDVRRRLGLAPLEGGRASMNVVVRNQGDAFSLLVDEIGDVIDVASKELMAVPVTLDPSWKKIVTGVSRLDGGLLLVVNLAAILNFDA